MKQKEAFSKIDDSVPLSFGEGLVKRNELYPIFLKVHQLNVLIVGGGNVGLEKLSFLLKSSPNATVEVVAPKFLPELVDLVSKHDSVKLTMKKFKKKMQKWRISLKSKLLFLKRFLVFLKKKQEIWFLKK